MITVYLSGKMTGLAESEYRANFQKEELTKEQDEHLAELEKENAELKKQLEMSNKVYNDNLDYSHHIEGQLTKAIELLKQFLKAKNSEDTYKAEWEAEQFLNSEVKK